MNTVKENKDITKKEARFIQYSKLVFGLYGLIVLTIIMFKI